MATSNRSPPDSSDSRRTLRPAGRTSTSTPVFSRFSGSVSERRPVPPGKSVVTRAEKCSLTSVKAASNTCMISSSRVRITWCNSRRALRTSSTWASRNWWRSPSSESSSRARGLTGPRAASSASSCSTRETGSTPSGSSGRGAATATSGLHASSRRRASTTDSRRIVLSTRSISAFCNRLRAAASSCSAPVALAQFGERRVQRGLGRSHHDEQTLDGGGFRLQPPTSLRCLTALFGVPGQAALDLGQALGQDAATLDQAGRPHLPLAATSRRLRDPLVDAAALLARRGHPLGGSCPRLLERRQPGQELGQAGVVADDPFLELGVVAIDLFELGVQRRPLVGHPLATGASRLVGDLVAVVGPDRLGGGLPRRLHLGAGRGPLLRGRGRGHPGHLGPGPC